MLMKLLPNPGVVNELSHVESHLKKVRVLIDL